jgi:hypothetical protein
VARHRREEPDPYGPGRLGIDDPRLRARWAEESELIRVTAADERFLRRRKVIWILLVGVLLTAIAVAGWTILATSPW